MGGMKMVKNEDRHNDFALGDYGKIQNFCYGKIVEPVP
jgi:hypothetical protein